MAQLTSITQPCPVIDCGYRFDAPVTLMEHGLRSVTISLDADWMEPLREHCRVDHGIPLDRLHWLKTPPAEEG